MNSADEIRIDAWFATDPSAVFAAWVEPDQLAAWFAAGEWRVRSVNFEPVIGSSWRIDFSHPDGAQYIETGRVIDVLHAQRLEFTLKQEGLELPVHETRIIVSFTEENGGTRLTFVQSGFGADHLRRDSNNAGWRTCFIKLREMLDRT